jgi:outer membrane lipoprotein-sorting protein
MAEKSRFMAGISFSVLGMTRRALLGGLVVAPLAGFAAQAAQLGAAPMTLSESDRSELKRISNYLDGIHTMRARFEQKAAGGGLAYGEIYLRRPGRIRVEYQAPAHALLVADGVWLSYYDTELDERTQIPISQTPLWFLLQDKIDFTTAATLTRVGHSAGELRVSLHQTQNPGAGSVLLTFAEEPLRLKQWRITDSQGATVDVALQDEVFGGSLSDDLFATPRIRGHHGQRIVD